MKLTLFSRSADTSLQFPDLSPKIVRFSFGIASVYLFGVLVAGNLSFFYQIEINLLLEKPTRTALSCSVTLLMAFLLDLPKIPPIFFENEMKF